MKQTDEKQPLHTRVGIPVSSTNKTDHHDITEIYCVFSFVSKKEVRHGYMGGGGRVFFVNYTLDIFISGQDWFIPYRFYICIHNNNVVLIFLLFVT